MAHLPNYLEEYMSSCSESFLHHVWAPVVISVVSIAASLGVFFFLPSQEARQSETAVTAPSTAEQEEDLFFSSFTLTDEDEDRNAQEDEGLLLYRQSDSRAAVEWFYTQVTGSRDIALAVLQNADAYNVPVALAFSLAHTESNYKVTAKHVNSNNTIDRGLFQLNSASFPSLTEAEFFDPAVSAHYGMSHLRFCLNTAGNEIAALAMYNAGTSKVRSGGTPQQTLNYISQIESYRSLLEDTFNREVVAYYSNQSIPYGDKLLALKR